MYHWKDYFRQPLSENLNSECRTRCFSAFAQERQNILSLLTNLRPKNIVCLGAGLLNDIPYPEMVGSGSSLTFVEWIPGSADAGVDFSILKKKDDGTPACAYCYPPIDCPEDYCANFLSPPDSSASVCSNYEPRPKDPERCASFKMGSKPRILVEDATAGYADAFGEAVSREFERARGWRQALRLGEKAALKSGKVRQALSIPDASVDLVTSSMVLSQFEHEPYGFFSKGMAQTLGAPSESEEESLRPALERLRETLFMTQIERHCAEISRILKPSGRAYVSFEMYRFDKARGWILLDYMARALSAIGARFDFDFETLPPSSTRSRFENAGSSSRVESYLLRRRT